MKTVLRTLLVIILTVVAVFAFLLLWPNGERSEDSNSGSAGEHVAGMATSHPRNSNQVIKPYDLSRNPYMLNGQRAILNTKGIPMIDGMGRFQGEAPFNALRYANMIDENTAIYDVLIGDVTLHDSGGQIAVLLTTDSAKPELGRPWQVVVQRPMRVVNGLGVEHNIATVSFQGYGSLPAPLDPPAPRPSETVKPEIPTAPDSPADEEPPSHGPKANEQVGSDQQPS